MRRLSLFCAVLCYALSSCTGSAVAPDSPDSSDQSDQSVHESPANLVFPKGLFPVAWDPRGERLLMEIPELEKPLLYTISLPQGLGSNDVGLDRGQLGQSFLAEFQRVGNHILLVAPNQSWRSTSKDADVRDGLQRAFAQSVLGSFPILEKGTDSEESSDPPRIDITTFCLRDAHRIATKLKAAGQGAFQLDTERCLALPQSIKVFPQNTAVEVIQTFAADEPGAEVRATTPEPNSISLRVRHSFVALPDLASDTYRARAFHPASGYFPLTWNDANTPLGEDTRRRVIQRHRLTREQPLVYRIDRATPEPMRSALLEGAKYWEPIFDAAVFPGAFRVELLPEGADPDDLRWNIVQWVERSTRGWSYGNSVVDPRTGEILKGHVTLGALRVRQDVLLFEGLCGAWRDGTLAPEAKEAALARLRQLAAHEIGHTLGLAHNFAASVDDRASVMDYPAPLVRLTEDGEIDLSHAYAPGCGPWDLFAIRYGYGDYDDQPDALLQLVQAAKASGLHYASDADARGNDRAHPLANLWDNGSDAVEQLEQDLAVRAVALANFSKAALAPARPIFELERALVPLYLGHRYQTEAVARLLGGRWYDYNLASDPAAPTRPVAATEQRKALAAVLHTLEPDILALDPKLVAQLPPPPPGYGRDRETFRANGPFFDPTEASRVSADISLGLLLNPARSSRLVDQHALDPQQLSLEEVLAALEARWFPLEIPAQGWGATEEVVRDRLLEHLMHLAQAPDAPDRVRAPVLERLAQLQGRLALRIKGTPRQPEERLYESRLRHFLEDPAALREERFWPVVPPGSPIGAEPFCSLPNE